MQKFHLEHQWFPSLIRSLLAITDRSENLIFCNKVQALVKVEVLLRQSVQKLNAALRES
jgi:hypothetical protein